MYAVRGGRGDGSGNGAKHSDSVHRKMRVIVRNIEVSQSYRVSGILLSVELDAAVRTV